MIKKIVLTGGPCCGKTTLINRLKEEGSVVLGEVAREVIEERKNYEATRKEIEERQKEIFRRQFEREEGLKGEGIAFLDRCIIDGFAYSRYYLGRIPFDISGVDLQERYSLVFELERLPFENDGLRVEKGNEEARKIHNEVMKEYKSWGYCPIFLPNIGIEERIEMIKRNIEGGRWFA